MTWRTGSDSLPPHTQESTPVTAGHGPALLRRNQRTPARQSRRPGSETNGNAEHRDWRHIGGCGSSKCRRPRPRSVTSAIRRLGWPIFGVYAR